MTASLVHFVRISGVYHFSILNVATNSAMFS